MTIADAASGPYPEVNPWLSQAASLSLHLSVIAALALMVPPPVASEETSAEDVAWIHQLLVSAGTGTIADGAAQGEEGGGQDVGSGGQPEGSAPKGSPTKSRADPPRHAREIDTASNRRTALQQAAVFGMIGLLSDGASDSSLQPTPWGHPDENGDLRENLFRVKGNGLEGSTGAGEIGLFGIGEGAGGRGEGIGIGDIGTLGHGYGVIGGEGIGSGAGRVRGSHQIQIREAHSCGDPAELPPNPDRGCTTTVNGRLPPEIIQRIIRQSFGRCRLCYEDGLRRDPGLEGRVSVRFVIDREGSVTTAADAGSDLRDESVVSCMVRDFQALSFPEPAGGIVTVVYPLLLSAAL
jgi:hypothetical protein